MHRNFRLVRELNSSDVEIYQLQEYLNRDNTICYFMLVDTHRPATLEDFPYLKGISTEEEVERDNFIKAYIVSDKEPNDELYEQIDGIIEELTFHLIAPSLEWNNSLIVVSNKEFKQIKTDRKYMLSYFDRILENENYSFTISSIAEDEYNHLCQTLSKRK